MFTHSWRDTYPPPRYDAIPWTRVLTEESANGVGGWVLIDDQAIAVDPTPGDPDAISHTVSTATLAQGFYRFIFDVTPSNPSPPSSAVTTIAVGWAPASGEIAALMFSRVTGEFAVGADFTAASRPTIGQVNAMIGLATGHVAARVGVLDARLHQAARYVTTLYTALLLEPGFWPEQQRPDKSAWEQWKLLYDDAMIALLAAATEIAVGGEIGPEDTSGLPIWWFPPAPRHEW